jgi:hypothetical protein
MLYDGISHDCQFRLSRFAWFEDRIWVGELGESDVCESEKKWEHSSVIEGMF